MCLHSSYIISKSKKNMVFLLISQVNLMFLSLLLSLSRKYTHWFCFLFHKMKMSSIYLLKITSSIGVFVKTVSSSHKQVCYTGCKFHSWRFLIFDDSNSGYISSSCSLSKNQDIWQDTFSGYRVVQCVFLGPI